MPLSDAFMHIVKSLLLDFGGEIICSLDLDPVDAFLGVKTAA